MINFSFSKKSAIGLDLGDLSLRMAQFKKQAGKFMVSGFIEKTIPEGLIKDGEIEQEDKLSGLIKDALLNSIGDAFQGNEVVCNLPEEKVFVRIIQLPAMKREELDQAVKWEAEAHIPLGIDEVYLDWSVINPVGDKKENHIDILIAAAPKTLVESYLSLLHKSELYPVALEPESVAVARLLISPDNNKPTIIVDISSTGANFVIISEGVICFTAHTPLSDWLFTESLLKEFDIDEKKAELLKREVGLCIDKSKVIESIDLANRESIYNALSPVADKFVEQIIEYITFYHDHVGHIHKPDKEIEQIIFCGDISVAHLSEYITQKVKIQTSLCDCAKNIVPSIKIKNKFKNKCEDKFGPCAVVFGLALRNFDLKSSSIE
ncbi:MAG: type IV pilus assembly protein PilM [bacterium]